MTKFRFKTGILTLLVLLSFNSCDDPIDTQALVFTEDVIFISGEIMRVTGRVVASGEISVSDHGFQIDVSESFSSPIIISLGERSIPGRFIGAYEDLSTGTDYFVRSYMVDNGETKVGETIQFTTLNSELSSFTPNIQRVGESITILGRSLTREARVLFGDVEAEILQFKFESVLRVRVPNPEPGKYVVDLKVISDGKTLTFPEPFEYVIGKWTNISGFPGPSGFSRNAFFSNGDKLYAGITAPEGTPDQIFWTYDISDQAWTQTNYSGTFVENPGLFNGGIVGGESSFFLAIVNGQTRGVYGLSRQFWQINGSNEFESLGNVPFELHRTVTMRDGDDLYVVGGWDWLGEFSPLVWRYNFTSAEWTQHDLAPSNFFSLLPHFQHNGLLYVFDPDGALFKYDPRLKSWEQVNQYPGDRVSLAMGVVLGDYAYVGLASQQRQLFEYDIVNNSWKEKTAITGVNSDIILGYYSVGDRIYVLRSQNLGNGSPALFEFDPFDL